MIEKTAEIFIYDFKSRYFMKMFFSNTPRMVKVRANIFDEINEIIDYHKNTYLL